MALRPIARTRRWRAFALGFVSGLVHFAGILYWIPDVLVTYGGLPNPLAVAAGSLLVAYLALFPGLFALALAELARGVGPSAILFAPPVWVSTEVGRTYLLSGFPWELLGYSQTTVLPVAQLASVFGVYGLSALVMLVNTAVAYAIVARGRRRLVVMSLVAAGVAATAGWGAWRVREGALLRAGTAMRVGLVQGNIVQDDKWNPLLRGRILDRHVRLSEAAASRGAEFIIWPESSTPFYFGEHQPGDAAIRQLARRTSTYLLLGSDEIERGRSVRYYNAAFLVTPGGDTAAVYRKIQLVPFGEYVPLRRLLFFVKPLVESVSDFSPGTEPVTLPVSGHLASTAVCYEVIYPGLVRRFVRHGSELLTAITNDAWYGDSSAPHQHLQQAVLRAIEQGRYLVRAANTGISGIVDPYGRVQARSRLFEETVIVGEVRWLRGRTVYSRIGDVLAWLCLLVTGAALVAAWLGRLSRAGVWRPSSPA